MSSSSYCQPPWQTMYMAKSIPTTAMPSNQPPTQPSTLSRFEQLLKAKLAAEQHIGFVPTIQPAAATHLDQASSRLAETNTVFNRAFARQHYHNPPPPPSKQQQEYQTGYTSASPIANSQLTQNSTQGYSGYSDWRQPVPAPPHPARAPHNDPFQSGLPYQHTTVPPYAGMQSSMGMNGQSADYHMGNFQTTNNQTNGFFGVPLPMQNPVMFPSTPATNFDKQLPYDTSPVCVKIEPDLVEVDHAPTPAWVNGAMRPPNTPQTWINCPPIVPPAKSQSNFDAYQSAYPYLWSTPVSQRNELCPPSLESSTTLHSTSSSIIPLPVTPSISPPTPSPHFQQIKPSMPLPYHHINRYNADVQHSPASSIRSIKSEPSLVSLGPAMFMDMNGKIRMPTLTGASAGVGGEDGMNGLGSYDGNAGYEGGGGGDGDNGNGNGHGGNGDGGMNGGGGGGSGSGSGGGSRDGDGGDGGDGGNGRTPKGKKLVLACHFCRRRKLKCDGVKPNCNNCSRRNEVCTYDDNVRRRGPGRRTKEMRERAQREAEEGGMVNENSLGAAVAAIGDGLDLGQGDGDLGLQNGMELRSGGVGEPSTLAEISGKGKDGIRTRDEMENGIDGGGKRLKLDDGNGELVGLTMDSSTIPLDPELDPALEALSCQHLSQHQSLGEVDLGDGDHVEVDYQTLEGLGGIGEGDVEVDFQALERLERHFAEQGQVAGLEGSLHLGEEDGVGGYQI